MPIKKDLTHDYPTHLKASIKKKAELYRLLKIDKLKYKEIYDSITLHIKIQTRNFHAKRQNAYITKNKNAIYKYINRFKFINNEIPVLYHNNKFITNAYDKAEIFANIFLENFSNINMQYNNNNNISDNNIDHTAIIDDADFDLSDIIFVINKLPDKNGTSPDNINYEILKKILPSIAPFLLEIFRISLDSSIIPNIWKESIVIPLFKKGEKSNPENYRPIALTCSICRIMERILSKYIIQFLMDNNLLSNEQYGFIRNRSTTTQLISTLEDWYDAIMGKKNIDCIYIDFKKAFDSVPHDLLIIKLHKIGIRGKILKWITTFLSQRTFRVKINDKLSKPRNIKSGVPQGSVLGPLLFLIYINDLPDIIPNGIKIKLFADDVKIYVLHKTKNERKLLNIAIKNIEQWATQWKLNIATNKTFIIYIGKNNPKDQYKIFDNTINEVESIRDLGIIIDNKLKFQEHIQKIIRIAYMRMNFVFRIIKSKSIKIWLTIYKSYIRPLLEYSPETWNPQLKSDINKLEKCQKVFTKCLLKKCSIPYIPYLQRIEFLNLPTLENRRKTYDLVLAHKILHGYTHLKSDQLFKISKRKNFYLLSKNQNFKSSSSFINRVTKMWNVLNEETRATKTTLSFKNKVKAILIQ
uniref:Reverse transcriptase domain-containing protein n=1 Tax=Meloidogyne hapla TaxID=6305 RepID=A0A1I8BR38_MELHA